MCGDKVPIYKAETVNEQLDDVCARFLSANLKVCDVNIVLVGSHCSGILSRHLFPYLKDGKVGGSGAL